MNQLPLLDADDPDLALVANYLARELSPEAASTMEERFVSDPAFYDKVAPLIKAALLPAKYVLPHLKHPPRLLMRTAIATHERWQPTARLIWRVTKWAAAAGVVLVLGGVAVFVTDVMTGSTSANDSAMQRAPSGPARFGKRVETKPGETVIEELRSGSRITLRGDSRLTYSPIVLSLGATRYVALDGEAAFEISPTEDPVEVHTWAGKLFLERGSYAVRCAPGCSAMLVTVGAGLAAIRGDTAKPAMLLKPGDYGRVRRGGEPEKVSAGVDAWPALEKGRSKP